MLFRSQLLTTQLPGQNHCVVVETVVLSNEPLVTKLPMAGSALAAKATTKAADRTWA